MSFSEFVDAIVNNEENEIEKLICQDYINKVDIEFEYIDESNDPSIANVYGNDKYTPIILSIFLKNISVAKLLFTLCKKKNINLHINKYSDKGVTPLYFAVQNNYYKFVKLFIQNNANVNLLNENRTSPLVTACTEGYIKIVQLLIQSNADVNLCSSIDGQLRISPLIAACFKGHIDIVKLLIENGANINYQLYNGRTALMYSVLIPKCQLVAEILIQYGADINIKDNDGETVLSLLLKKKFHKMKITPKSYLNIKNI